MGIFARGEFLDQNDERVTYRFGDASEEWHGVVEIPVNDVWAWRVAGSDARPRSAEAVVVKIIRYYDRTGTWPPMAFFQS